MSTLTSGGSSRMEDPKRVLFYYTNIYLYNLYRCPYMSVWVLEVNKS